MGHSQRERAKTVSALYFCLGDQPRRPLESPASRPEAISRRRSTVAVFPPAAGERLSTTGNELLQLFGIDSDVAAEPNNDAIREDPITDQPVDALRPLIEPFTGVGN